MHAMRRKALANASAKLEKCAAEVERLHDGARVFLVVCLLCQRPYLQTMVHNEHGRTVEDSVQIYRQMSH